MTNEERKLALRRHDQKDEWPEQNLQGQCSEIFDFRFFSFISFPQAPEYAIRAFTILFANSWRFSQLKVHHHSH